MLLIDWKNHCYKVTPFFLCNAKITLYSLRKLKFPTITSCSFQNLLASCSKSNSPQNLFISPCKSRLLLLTYETLFFYCRIHSCKQINFWKACILCTTLFSLLTLHEEILTESFFCLVFLVNSGIKLIRWSLSNKLTCGTYEHHQLYSSKPFTHVKDSMRKICHNTGK